MNGVEVSFEIFLISLRFAANFAHKRSRHSLFTVPIDHVTLKTFLEQNCIALWALYVGFDLRVNRLAMIFHVALSLEGFFADIAVVRTNWIVHSFNVIVEVVGRVCFEETVGDSAFVFFEILVALFVHLQEVSSGVALVTFVALEGLFFGGRF